MQYSINNKTIEYNAKGQTALGNDVVLLDDAIDLTLNTPWAKAGFCIDTLFDGDTYLIFQQQTRKLLLSLWKRAGLHIADDFKLEDYHHIANTNELHLAAVDCTKLLSTTLFPVVIDLLEKRVSEICNQTLIAHNPFDQQRIFHFRVVRPNKPDNNPLHRDVWLEDYKDCINLYIPVAGSNENSSLIIVPESHHWPEATVERTIAGAEINGIQFNVPAVTHVNGALRCIRPNPQLNEVLVFSPYLIHGGSLNLNTDSTRISIEIRLWKK